MNAAIATNDLLRASSKCTDLYNHAPLKSMTILLILAIMPNIYILRHLTPRHHKITPLPPQPGSSRLYLNNWQEMMITPGTSGIFILNSWHDVGAYLLLWRALWYDDMLLQTSCALIKACRVVIIASIRFSSFHKIDMIKYLLWKLYGSSSMSHIRGGFWQLRKI